MSEKDRSEEAWQAYLESMPNTPEAVTKPVFMAGYEAAKRHLNYMVDVEWGIEYHDNPKETPIDPIKSEPAAKGIFKHYGEPGDKLVRRITRPWEVIDKK